MSRRPRVPVVALLVGGNLLAGGWLLSLIMLADMTWEPSEAIEPSQISIPEVRSTASLPPRDELLARPLFWETRRPVSRDRSPAVDDTDILGRVKVLGLMGSGEGGSIVFDDGTRIGVLRVGQTISGWLLVGVETEQALFRRDEEERPLRLERPSIEEGFVNGSP